MALLTMSISSRKKFLIVILVWILVGALALWKLPLAQWLGDIRDWILALGALGPCAYVGVYVLFCIFLIPSVALSMGVGPVWGFGSGLLYTVIASNIGGTVAFFLGRTLLRKRVERWAETKPQILAIDTAVRENALKVVTLLRMSPIFPFTITNYALALTGVPYWKYALGTFIGMLPLNAAFIYVSCEAANAAGEIQKQEVNFHRLAFRLAGIAMTLLALAVISRIALRAVKRTTP